MDGAAARLVLRSEEKLDLFVSFVDRAHAAGFLVGLAAEAQGRFREALCWLGHALILARMSGIRKSRVAFRSAKERPFAERKATLDTSGTAFPGLLACF
jgi:hypothetical protein